MHVITIVAFFLAISTTIFQPNTGYAETSAADIRNAAKGFMQSHEKSLLAGHAARKVNTVIGHIDPRLTLNPCPQPLTVSLAHENRQFGRLSLKVSCMSTWFIYVTATVTVMDTVMVSANAIPRGQALTASMLTAEERDISRLHHGYYNNANDLLGYIPTRTIGMRQVITPGALSQPMAVGKHEEVTITSSTSGITVIATGIALASGATGDRIPVRNKLSQRVIEARISGPGSVEVNP